MLLVLQEFFAGHTEVLRTIPNLEEISNALNVLLTEIQEASMKQLFHRHGEVAGKKQLKANLIRQCADVSRKLAACAALNKDLVLLYEIKASDTALGHMAEGKLISFSEILHDRGTRHQDKAAAFGLLPQNLSDLEAARVAFFEAISGPRMSIIAWKIATDNLATLFKQVDEQLGMADLLVGIVRLSNPDFFSLYRNSRMIVDRAGRGLQLIFSVTDKENKQPLPGALCRLAYPEQPDHPIHTKRSAAKGNLKVKSLESGKYLLTATLPGYQKFSRDIYVTKGEFIRVGVEMEKLKVERWQKRMGEGASGSYLKLRFRNNTNIGIPRSG